MTQIQSQSQEFAYTSSNEGVDYDAQNIVNAEEADAEKKSANWLKKHKNKLLLGGAAIAFALTLPQLPDTIDGVKENAEWAIPAAIATESAWYLGAAVMVASAGKRVGNPLKLKSRMKEITSELSDNRLFRTGMGINITGAAGTSAIIAAGSVAELPAGAWPGAFLVAGASLAPSLAIWNTVRGKKSQESVDLVDTAIEAKDADKQSRVFESEIFKDNQDATFWVGEIADTQQIYDQVVYDAQAKFRADVYVEEMKFLDTTHIDSSGRELDGDDSRSLHFTVLENLGNSEAKVVGAARLIYKNHSSEQLPIEKYFPEIFQDNPLPENAVEVSRFIARHEDDATQHAIALSVIRALTLNSVNKKVEADYCIIEEPLMKLLQMIGIPVETLGQPKDIDEYGGRLYPIRINPYKVIDSVTNDVSGKIILKRFFGKEIENDGLGFYPTELTGGKL